MTLPMPKPTAIDWQNAERFVVETYDNDPGTSRVWLAAHRADLVRMAAVAEMQKREHRLLRNASVPERQRSLIIPKRRIAA